MTKRTLTAVIGGCTAFAILSLSSLSQAQEIKGTELKRGDLTGTNMEIVVGIYEIPPGASIPLHTHPGEEAYYVIEGGKITLPDGKEVTVPDGAADINVRDVPHAGIKVVGDKPIKLLTVHIVDKGKPMMVLVKKE
jgi:quercetin dioxygenase-like cupin family protein